MLDKFYTRPQTAARCYRHALVALGKMGAREALYFIEPSAGAGSFYGLLPAERRAGMDIAPGGSGIRKGDFLKRKRRFFPVENSRVVAIGNPPFGKRGKLAVDFFNAAARFADTVAFIVPVIFRKYFIHKTLDPNFQWVSVLKLPPASFYTPDGRDYNINAEFQVWTRLSTGLKNKRLFTAPPVAHPDFKMHQYNNTREALKVFALPFDFAVPAQGYQDYTRRESNPANCEKHKQWMLFHTASEEVKRNLFDMDYERLAHDNITVTPGFRKNDVVGEYIRNFGSQQENRY
ncbi:MAG: hypothetical protein OXU94_00570 [Gammaproteobacteria bacterium]|nr:hypothetical protein [Gammaproteobacteria bacterium]